MALRARLRRAAIAFAAGPARPVAVRLYRAFAALIAHRIRRIDPNAAVYASGSLASDELVPGLSDLDLVVVVPGDPGEPDASRRRFERRWKRFRARLPAGMRGMVAHVGAYEEPALAAVLGTTVLESPEAVRFGDGPPPDGFALRSRRGIGPPGAGWRLLAGPERRPSVGPGDQQGLRICAWLELQFLWGFTYRACAEPELPWVPYMWAKLVADSGILALALEDDAPSVTPRTRRQALRELARSEPGLGEAAALAEKVLDAPARGPDPAEPLLECALGLAERIARATAAGLSGTEPTSVLLTGAATDSAQSEVPLADWRAVVMPSLPDERLHLLPEAGALTVRSIREALGRREPGVALPAFRRGDLVLQPSREFWTGGYLRAIQCPATDPVTAALVAGRAEAEFPGVRGWSAADWSRRAVAEHRAWLARPPAARLGPAVPEEWLDGNGDLWGPGLRALAKTLTAARAGLFSASVARGRPELCLTMAATAERLGADDRSAAPAASAALAAYAAASAATGHQGADDEARSACDALMPHVLALAPYAGTGSSS